MTEKPKVVFVSESIRRDSHAPLRFFKDIEPIHLYLKAPYGDMTADDLGGAKEVKIDALLDEIIKIKPAVIQGVEPFGSRLAFRLAQITQKAQGQTGAKLIVPVFENRPILKRFNFGQRAALRLFCPKFFRRASAVVVLNRGAKRNVLSYAPKAKIVEGIVWGVWGVDSELFKPLGTKIPGSIIYVGRWVEDKGLKYLLEGFRLAASKVPELKLSLFGQGPYENTMRQFVKENSLEKNVEFVGQIPNTKLPEYFGAAELSVYPSITMPRWEEQVGTVNFQAMACETPVLTTRSGAIEEYLGEAKGAILVPERDSQAIAEAIENYFQSKNKKALQKEARQFIMRYDIRSEIAKAEKLIKSLL